MRVGSVRHRAVIALRLAAAWRPTGRRLRGLVRATFTSYLAIGALVWILPDLHAPGPLSILALVLVTFVVGAVLRPVLMGVAVLFGSGGLLLGGVLSQAIVLDIALLLAPNVNPGPFRDVVLASWLLAGISAVVNWIFDVGSDEGFLARVLGRSARAAQLDPRAVGAPGLLVVQIDGLGEDVLRQAVAAGAAPTLSRWLRQGTHVLRPWQTGLPSTTPAMQAVLLHGDTHQIPCFRWYEKATGRLMVANRPRDTAEIEHRISDGKGLLAYGGASVANLFSGDAPVRLLTMSDPRLTPRARRGLAGYLSDRGGLPRSVALMIGVMITELQQGRRQRRRDVRPRVDRRSVFVVLRAVTTVLLRNSALTLVADQLAAGAPVIYVDFVDYDEVAHHAGPSRPESMRTLDGIDRVLQLLETLAGRVNRRYEIAVVSDHGQSQGPTFRQEAGRTLDELVGELIDLDVPATPPSGADAAPAERWGPLNLLLTGRARQRSKPDASFDLGRLPTPVAHTRRPVVVAGGSLAHVYLPEVSGRALLEQIEAAHPRLVKGLSTHPQVGLVVVRSADGDLRAIGRDGWRSLDADADADADASAGAGVGEGPDPLLPYGPGAAAALRQLDSRAHVGDLVVLGRADPVLGDVIAFEELVGSHGGLGGAQTRAILIAPRAWEVPDTELDGLGVYRRMVARLTDMGLRE